jgi:hypothetical protein
MLLHNRINVPPMRLEEGLAIRGRGVLPGWERARDLGALG